MAPDVPRVPGTGVVQLRRTLPSDVRALFEIQLDPAGNELAGTKPRDWAAFDARWEEILRDTPEAGPGSAGVTPRVIVVDGVLVGSINVFPQEGKESIGYWIDRAHWGRGIATRAIGLMVDEVQTRPLYARVMVHNVASLRALERNGFKILSRGNEGGGERYVGGERYMLVLDNRGV